MKQWSEIGTKPIPYSKITLGSKGVYTVFIDADGTEEALTTFTSIQVGHCACFDGDQPKQLIWYDKKDCLIWMGGPQNLLQSILKGTMEASAA